MASVYEFLDEMLEAGHGGNRRPAAGFSAQVAQVAQVAQLPRSMKALTWQVLWTRPRPDPWNFAQLCPWI